LPDRHARIFGGFEIAGLAGLIAQEMDPLH
jgi:hypothetical protein